MVLMRFGAKLDKLIGLRGTTQAEVARTVGTYPSRVSEWVSEKGSPSIRQALLVARVLGVPLDYLADDDQDDPPSAVSTDRERQVLEMIREIGPDEAWRRLVVAARQSPPAPAGQPATEKAHLHAQGHSAGGSPLPKKRRAGGAG